MNAFGTKPQLWPEIRVMLLAAMVIFLYTIGIGILNGTDAVDFDQRRILGHVHGGTLGWLTLAVFSASLWLFGELKPVSERERTVLRWLVGAAIVTFTVYIWAFSVTYGEWRPAIGTVAVLVIAAFFSWVLMRVELDKLSVPHWGFLAAMGTSIIGGVLGVLWGMQIATGNSWLPTDGGDSHPAAMVVGFLFPVAMAMSEWAFRYPDLPKATRLGIIQMVFPFAGGIVLMLSLLLGIDPLAPVAILLELVGVGIFLWRMWPSFKDVDWLQPSAARYATMSAISSAWVIGLAQYFVIRHKGDFDLVPTHQILALDHSQFIGAMTNAVFAMLLTATVAKGVGKPLDQLVFLLVNVGIIGFAIALLGDITVMKQIFAPTMGVGLLIGLGLFAWRLLAPAPVAESS